jgi:hypothetical protein
LTFYRWLGLVVKCEVAIFYHKFFANHIQNSGIIKAPRRGKSFSTTTKAAYIWPARAGCTTALVCFLPAKWPLTTYAKERNRNDSTRKTGKLSAFIWRRSETLRQMFSHQPEKRIKTIQFLLDQKRIIAKTDLEALPGRKL